MHTHTHVYGHTLTTQALAHKLSLAHTTVPTLAQSTRVDFHRRCLKVSEKHTPKIVHALPVMGLSIPLKEM